MTGARGGREGWGVVNVSLEETARTGEDIRAHFRRVARKHELLPVRGTFSAACASSNSYKTGDAIEIRS